MSRTSSTPPVALPPICANWAAMRIIDLAGTYASSDTLDRTRAALAPPEMDESVPMPSRSANRTGTGIAGQAINPASSADAASQPATSRRGRTRSTMLERRPPPSRYGRNPSAKVSDASSGDSVRRKTTIVSATAATLVPPTETSCPAKIARNSREAMAAP